MNRISSKNFLLYYNENKLSIQETYGQITKILPINTLFEIVITKTDSRETYVFISCEKKLCGDQRRSFSWMDLTIYQISYFQVKES